LPFSHLLSQKLKAKLIKERANFMPFLFIIERIFILLEINELKE